MENFLFRHILEGIHIQINSISLEGAQAILLKIVVDEKQWEYYK